MRIAYHSKNLLFLTLLALLTGCPDGSEKRIESAPEDGGSPQAPDATQSSPDGGAAPDAALDAAPAACTGAQTTLTIHTPALWATCITAGADGNLWWGTFVGPDIVRTPPAGVSTVFPLPSGMFNPEALTLGADGAIWFSFETRTGGFYWAGEPSYRD